MSSTTVWVPVASAVAALVGGGLGAMLQGRYGVSGWRRQTRLEAYATFLNATHNFNRCLLDALLAFGESAFEGKWAIANDAWAQMAYASSVVNIAGPLSVLKPVEQILRVSRQIMEGTSKDEISNMATAIKNNRSFDKRNAWLTAANDFEFAARRVLKTQGS